MFLREKERERARGTSQRVLANFPFPGCSFHLWYGQVSLNSFNGMLFHSPFGQDLLCSPSQLFSFFKVSASCGQYPFNPAMLLHLSGLHGSLWLQANCLADSTRFQLVDNNFPSSSKSRLFTCSLLKTKRQSWFVSLVKDLNLLSRKQERLPRTKVFD